MWNLRCWIGGAAIGALLALAPVARAEDIDKAKISAGEDVYNSYCLVCHGFELVNSGQSFDLRKLGANDRPRFENSVTNGKNQMPPWKGVIGPKELDVLWAYIRAHTTSP